MKQSNDTALETATAYLQSVIESILLFDEWTYQEIINKARAQMDNWNVDTWESIGEQLYEDQLLAILEDNRFSIIDIEETEKNFTIKKVQFH